MKVPVAVGTATVISHFRSQIVTERLNCHLLPFAKKSTWNPSVPGAHSPALYDKHISPEFGGKNFWDLVENVDEVLEKYTILKLLHYRAVCLLSNPHPYSHPRPYSPRPAQSHSP